MEASRRQYFGIQLFLCTESSIRLVRYLELMAEKIEIALSANEPHFEKKILYCVDIVSEHGPNFQFGVRRISSTPRSMFVPAIRSMKGDQALSEVEAVSFIREIFEECSDALARYAKRKGDCALEDIVEIIRSVISSCDDLDG